MCGPIASPHRPGVSTDVGARVWEGCGLVQGCSPCRGMGQHRRARHKWRAVPGSDRSTARWLLHEARGSLRNWLSQQWVKWQGGKKCPIYLTTCLLCKVVISYSWHIGWESEDLLYLAASAWSGGWVSIWTSTKHSEIWEENCSVWGVAFCQVPCVANGIDRCK